MPMPGYTDDDIRRFMSGAREIAQKAAGDVSTQAMQGMANVLCGVSKAMAVEKYTGGPSFYYTRWNALKTVYGCHVPARPKHSTPPTPIKRLLTEDELRQVKGGRVEYELLRRENLDKG